MGQVSISVITSVMTGLVYLGVAVPQRHCPQLSDRSSKLGAVLDILCLSESVYNAHKTFRAQNDKMCPMSTLKKLVSPKV